MQEGNCACRDGVKFKPFGNQINYDLKRGVIAHSILFITKLHTSKVDDLFITYLDNG